MPLCAAGRCAGRRHPATKAAPLRGSGSLRQPSLQTVARDGLVVEITEDFLGFGQIVGEADGGLFQATAAAGTRWRSAGAWETRSS